MIYFFLLFNFVLSINENVLNEINKSNNNVKVIDYVIVDKMISTNISIGESSSRLVPIDLSIDSSFISSKFFNDKTFSSGIDSILYNSITYIMTSYKNKISFHSENTFNVDNFFFYQSEYGYVDHELISLSYKGKQNEKSVMYNLKQSDMISKESFTFVPIDDSKGKIVFGDISKMLNEYNKAVLSIENKTSSLWNTKLNEASIVLMNGTVVSLDNNSNLYFKSDNNDMIIPTEAYSKLTKVFFNNKQIDCSVYGVKYVNVLRCQCDVKTYFKKIVLKIDKYEFSIDDLFEENKGKCDFILKNKYGEKHWGIGYALFVNFITTFDKEDNKIVLYSKSSLLIKIIS